MGGGICRLLYNHYENQYFFLCKLTRKPFATMNIHRYITNEHFLQWPHQIHKSTETIYFILNHNSTTYFPLESSNTNTIKSRVKRISNTFRALTTYLIKITLELLSADKESQMLSHRPICKKGFIFYQDPSPHFDSTLSFFWPGRFNSCCGK